MNDERKSLDAILNVRVPPKPGPVPPPQPPTDEPPPQPPADEPPPQPPTDEPPPARVPRPFPPGPPAGSGPPPPREPEPWTAPTIGAQAEAAAAQLRHSAQELTAASSVTARRYEARSADGALSVTVDGRPRVAGISLRAGAAGLSAGDLASQLTGLINSALDKARRGTREGLMEAAGPGGQSWLRGVITASEQSGGGPGRAAPEGGGSR